MGAEMCIRDRFLEAAALDPAGVAEALRIGLASVMGDWRDDPAVQSHACRPARVWASSGTPPRPGGEPARLGGKCPVPCLIHIRTRPRAI